MPHGSFIQPAGEMKWYVGLHLLKRVLLPKESTTLAVRTSGSLGWVEFCAPAMGIDPSARLNRGIAQDMLLGDRLRVQCLWTNEASGEGRGFYVTLDGWREHRLMLRDHAIISRARLFWLRGL